MSKTQGFTPFVKQCYVSAAVCINVVGYGCMVGFPAVLLPQLREPGSIIPLSRDEETWITSLMGFTMLAGNLVTPGIMDRFGRKPMHIVVSVTGIIGWLMTALSINFLTLLTSRTILSLGFGMIWSLRSPLIGEYVSPKNRGSLLTLIALAQGGGIFLVHLLGTLFHWQTTSVICMFFPFTSLVMAIYSPESPSFLAAREKYDECRVAYHWLRGFDEEKELEDMISTRREMETIPPTKTNIRELLLILKKKEFYKPIVIMIHMNMMMQFSGAPVIATYATVVIGQLVGPTANTNFWMVFLDAQRTLLNGLTVFVMDRFKRRTMLFSVGGLSVLTHVLIAFYVYLRENGFVGDYQWITILLLNIQYSTIAVGLIPIPGILAGEIFPLEYRGIGGSISLIAVSVLAFFVLKSFPALVDNFGIHGSYAMYGGLLFYTLAVNWFLLPETKGKTLLDIEDEMRGRKLKPDEEEELKSLQKKNIRKVSAWSMHSMVVEP